MSWLPQRNLCVIYDYPASIPRCLTHDMDAKFRKKFFESISI